MEFWWPPAAALNGLPLSRFAQRVKATGLEVVLINFDAGEMAAGDRGLAGDPDRTARFRANVPVAPRLAGELGCRKLNALAGNAAPGRQRAQLLDILIENVGFAADAAQREGASIMLEALNPKDAPRYLLPRTREILETIRRVDRPNVKLQLDVYHVAMADDNPLKAIADARGMIGHVQIADVPGRHEPGTGRLPFDDILAALPKNGYAGPVGLEYVPQNPAARDFSFLSRWNVPQSQEVSR